MSLCRRVTENDREVLKLIEKRYYGCEEAYRESEELAHLISRKSDKIINDKGNKYIYIRDVLTKLKANR